MDDRSDLPAVCLSVRGAGAKCLASDLRASERQGCADRPELGFEYAGPFGAVGIRQMLERQSEQVSVAGAHAHAFRHSLVNEWLQAGGSETDLMAIGGWKGRRMF